MTVSFMGKSPTLSLQQRWIQKLHHVLDLRVQLRHVTLSHHISQHGQEVIGTIHPPWRERRKQTESGEVVGCGGNIGQTESVKDITVK